MTPEAFREALSHWASGVSIVAVRDEGRLYATTVSSFASVSAEPPQVVVSLSPGAQVLPFLKEGVQFGVSILGPAERRLASVFADSFPVGPDPFPAADPPLLPAVPAALVCRVARVLDADPARLVLARVEESRLGSHTRALVYHRRGYKALE